MIFKEIILNSVNKFIKNFNGVGNILVGMCREDIIEVDMLLVGIKLEDKLDQQVDKHIQVVPKPVGRLLELVDKLVVGMLMDKLNLVGIHSLVVLRMNQLVDIMEQHNLEDIIRALPFLVHILEQ